MGEFRVTINPKNKPATPEVNWQQARVLEMQAEYADAFDTQTGSYDEMCAAYGEERKMWNSGGPEMEETIEYQIPYEGSGTFTSSGKGRETAGYFLYAWWRICRR